MSDEIKDMDDVEAIAWALAWPTVWAFSNRSCDVAAENADECVRLLRERRAPSVGKVERMGAEWAADVAVDRERAKIVAWLRSPRIPSSHEVQARALAKAIEDGVHHNE